MQWSKQIAKCDHLGLVCSGEGGEAVFTGVETPSLGGNKNEQVS